ncbi:MAG: non-canonical purine NTP pyrophosphatase, partial [Chitinophagaceae bacterium]
ANIEKLLVNLAETQNRNAQFRTIISLIIDGQEYMFEGICKGKIIYERKGEKGFGYDPVFIPNGSSRTFGEMSVDEKGKYSHRAIATEKLVAFLSDYSLLDNLSTSH